jgi:hypothetical protein
MSSAIRHNNYNRGGGDKVTPYSRHQSPASRSDKVRCRAYTVQAGVLLLPVAAYLGNSKPGHQWRYPSRTHFMGFRPSNYRGVKGSPWCGPGRINAYENRPFRNSE